MSAGPVRPRQAPVIPVDSEAEEIAVAYAIGDRESAARAAEILDGSDFYHPRLRRLFSVAVQLDHISEEFTRTRAVATATGIARSWLEDFAGNRPSSRDGTGRFARRVREAARRRRLMALSAELYNGAASLHPDRLVELTEGIARESGLIALEGTQRLQAEN